MMIYGPILAALAIARCHPAGELPDRICTPGAVETVDLRVICGTSTRTRRNVSDAVRRERFASYGIAWADRGRYELDHLVPLELGGSNDPLNLWPEPIGQAARKDRVENVLHARVCGGTLALVGAQRVFQTDWSAWGR